MLGSPSQRPLQLSVTSSAKSTLTTPPQVGVGVGSPPLGRLHGDPGPLDKGPDRRTLPLVSGILEILITRLSRGF